MIRRLDLTRAGEIADAITTMLTDDGGYTPEESIPGLIQAVIDTADGDEELLDDAANFLVDGGLPQEEKDDANDDADI